MPTRKHIEPGTKIGLNLTAAERKLILDDLMCLDDSYAEVIKATPADQPVEFTLDDSDGLGGFIAAEADHTRDRKAGKKLDAIFNKVQKILDTYTDEEPLKTLKIEDARKAKHPQGNVAGVAKLEKDKTEKPKASTTAATVFQFKITLKEIEPLIWRSTTPPRTCTIIIISSTILMASTRCWRDEAGHWRETVPGGRVVCQQWGLSNPRLPHGVRHGPALSQGPNMPDVMRHPCIAGRCSTWSALVRGDPHTDGAGRRTWPAPAATSHHLRVYGAYSGRIREGMTRVEAASSTRSFWRPHRPKRGRANAGELMRKPLRETEE